MVITWLACAPPLRAPEVVDNPHQDWDRDGVTEAEGDCDDDDREARPGRAETCDGKDNDCDGDVDEDDAIDAVSWYQDLDGDAYGFGERVACAPPAGFVSLGGDCDDQDATRNPGAEEVCNELDDNCDGTVDGGAADTSTWYRDADEDGFGGDELSLESCEAPAGYIAEAGDCNDDSDLAWPGNPEVCGDGLDNDCNGLSSEPCLGEALEGAQRIDGEAGGDHAGRGLFGPGDLDGDGLDDLLVSATEHDGTAALNAGMVYLLRGPVSPGTTLEQADWTLEGLGKNEETGAELAAGEGWLAIGAPGADVGDGTIDRAGKAWLVPAVPESGSVEDAAMLTVAGRHESQRLGSALALLDDDTLAVGAERTWLAEQQPGAVYLVDLSLSGLIVASEVPRLDGYGAGSYAGSALASGDVDGDGLDELLVGAWGRSTYGSAYLLSGPWSSGPLTAGSELTGSEGSDFGWSLLIEDLDGDGLGEVVVGAPGDDSVFVDGHATLIGGEGFGTALGHADLDGDGVDELLVGGADSAWVVHGPVSGVLELPWGDSGELGARVEGLGDIDGDGHEDLAIGAPASGDAEEGAVLLLRGAAEGLPW